MRAILSDFRGRIAHLAFSDSGLEEAVKSGAWDLVECLISVLKIDQKSSSSSPFLTLSIGGELEPIRSKRDYDHFKKQWKDKSNQKSANGPGDFFEHPNTTNINVGQESSQDALYPAPTVSCDKSKFVRDQFLVILDRKDIVVLDNCYKGVQNSPNPILMDFREKHNYKLENPPLKIEGGDILVADTLVLIGYKSVVENGGLKNLAFFQQLEYMFGLSIFCPGCDLSKPPELLYHIDMFITVLGEENGIIDVAIGCIHIWSELDNAWVPRVETKGAKELQRYIDEIRQKLEDKHWFRITDWPLLYEGDSDEEGRLYSLNNCLVESSKGSKPRLLLPQYSKINDKYISQKFGRAECEFEKQFKNLYHIEWVPCSFHAEAESGAGLRCLTQVLRRSAD